MLKKKKKKGTRMEMITESSAGLILTKRTDKIETSNCSQKLVRDNKSKKQHKQKTKSPKTSKRKQQQQQSEKS